MSTSTSITSREDFLSPLLRPEAISMLNGGATLGHVVQLLPNAVDTALLHHAVYERVSAWVETGVVPNPTPSHSAEPNFISPRWRDELYDLSNDFWAQLQEDVRANFADYDEVHNPYPMFQSALRERLAIRFKGKIYAGMINTVARTSSIVYLLLPVFDAQPGVVANHDMLLKLWNEMGKQGRSSPSRPCLLTQSLVN